ncbi:galectin-8 [Diachasma alloeum]|uniref:galectin-8 n=1 Tax=Diachasma alloeum TaxID=454923 RepID=UPI0007383E4A|nr:galectin-8 [Diachasma alloeum]
MSLLKPSPADFEYNDIQAKLVSETSPVEPIRLEIKSAIIVIGYVPSHSKSFAFNLLCRSTGNIALHFNPRLERGYCVRNSKVKGSWETEETCSRDGGVNPIFPRNSYFHLLIFCGSREFQIAVNGEHFCDFPYRQSLESITNFEYVGDVEDVRIRLTKLNIYPDPKIVKPRRYLELSQEQPLSDNLKVPCTISLAQPLAFGTRIFIKGRLKLLPHSFYVNLQRSQLIYPHPEIALHLNPRFLFGNRPSCVVMNCWTNGAWSAEERHEGQLSWGPGRDFLLTIRCEYEGYNIWLDNKMIGIFQHRLEPTIVDTLHISGDVVIYQIVLNSDD